jgi:hypothetical protein
MRLNIDVSFETFVPSVLVCVCVHIRTGSLHGQAGQQAKQQLKSLKANVESGPTRVLSTPLEETLQEQVERQTEYAHTSEEVTKWY